MREQIKSIAQLLVKARVETRCEGIELVMDDSALDFIARSGYDPIFGARPLKRFIQKQVETQVAKLVIAGKLTADSQLRISAEGDRLVFSSH